MELNFIKGHDLSFEPILICLALWRVVLTQQENPDIQRPREGC